MITQEASGTPTSPTGLVLAMKYMLTLYKTVLSGQGGHILLPLTTLQFLWWQRKDGKHTWDKSSLYHQIPPGKRVIGDSGYLGEPDRVSTILGGHAPEIQELFASLKSRQETLFHGYKALKIFGGKSFCHKGRQGGGSKERVRVHELVFDAVPVLMPYNMKNGSPLFDV
ncbi:hypothetical protein HJC23_004256 [Cyclotella cryptica]|uniref:DDE Tnp4 domain-containing protein n=1 Tax=Cyclotella cryptica TaxID=29204 RepID=A0ABD3Q902_9STRA